MVSGQRVVDSADSQHLATLYGRPDIVPADSSTRAASVGAACRPAPAARKAAELVNFLFHMILSGADEQVLVGNFMGDFVKGPLEERFPERVRLGVALHRRIDSYADRHPVFRRSKQRLAAEYGLYRGVMLDLFYDYFLVNDWQRWSTEPLAAYLAGTRGIVNRHLEDLPPELRRLVPTIFDDLLPSYGTIEGIGAALSRMSGRLSRPNPLRGGEQELRRHHGLLRDDFEALAPDLFTFAREYRSA